MQFVDLPTPFLKAFAVDGNRHVLPVDSQIGITDGAASYADGFPPLTATPRAGGGVPPSILDMNGVLFKATQWLQALQAGRVILPFNSTFANGVGGYPRGALLASSTAGQYWLSTADNNTTNPDGSTPANWVSLFPASLSKATAADVQAGTDDTKYVTPLALAGATTAVFDPAAGYIIHPSGFIEQWGSDFTSIGTEGSRSITFPIAFPNECLGVSGTIRNTSQDSSGDTQVQEVSVSATGAVIYIQSRREDDGFRDAAGGYRWKAFGH